LFNGLSERSNELVRSRSRAGKFGCRRLARRVCRAGANLSHPQHHHDRAVRSKALDDETVKKPLLELGSVIPAPADRTPQALGTLVKNEIAKWTPVLKPATN